jgi:polysaccharide export outer membrane protein
MPTAPEPLLQLGAGDTVAIKVFNQPDLDTPLVYVADDGTVAVPLAGAVPVAGLSPSEAARRIEKALRDGKFVNNPQVSLTVTVSRSQRVSVLGEVAKPGPYPIDSRTKIVELLAEAGGTRDTGAYIIYLMRARPDGSMARFAIDLKGLVDPRGAAPYQTLQGGDVIFVPKAEQFYIYGEVASPGMYRIEPNMTVIQAIARAGGITARGRRHRTEVKRKDSKGNDVATGIRLDELVQPNDTIRVKESIF